MSYQDDLLPKGLVRATPSETRKTYTEEEVILYLRAISNHVRANGYGGHSINASFVRDWWAINK